MTEPPCTGTKVCRTCERELHVLAFAANPKAGDGLQSECRDCVGERAKPRYSAEGHRRAGKRRRFSHTPDAIYGPE